MHFLQIPLLYRWVWKKNNFFSFKNKEKKYSVTFIRARMSIFDTFYNNILIKYHSQSGDTCINLTLLFLMYMCSNSPCLFYFNNVCMYISTLIMLVFMQSLTFSFCAKIQMLYISIYINLMFVWSRKISATQFFL